jgi:hypothetical protein
MMNSQNFKSLGKHCLLIISSLVLFISSSLALSETHYTVYLKAGQQRLAIARLTIASMGIKNSYQLELVDKNYSDEFLSMRPFKCLDFRDNMLCYVAYPYQNNHNISLLNLTDLEYDLLFNARTKKEYGIDPWNGRYFRLSWQGDNIVGVLHEVDLNILAAPPPEGNLRPILVEDLSPIATTTNGAVSLLIEPEDD